MLFLHFISAFSLSRICTKTVEVDHNSIIASYDMLAGEILCINSSTPYLSVVLNEWSHCILTTYRIETISNDQNESVIIKDGIYTSDGLIDGFDFGKSIGSIEIEMIGDAHLSIGLINFRSDIDVRLISNHNEDKVVFDPNDNEAIFLDKNQHAQYFNTSPGERNYKIDIDTQMNDCLRFLTDNKIVQTYCGKVNEKRSNTNTIPEIVEISTDNSSTPYHVKFEVNTNYKSKKYVRFISNSDGYQPISSFEYDVFSLGALIGLIVGCIIFAFIVAFISVVIIVKRKRKKESKSNFKI